MSYASALVVKIAAIQRYTRDNLRILAVQLIDRETADIAGCWECYERLVDLCEGLEIGGTAGHSLANAFIEQAALDFAATAGTK